MAQYVNFYLVDSPRGHQDTKIRWQVVEVEAQRDEFSFLGGLEGSMDRSLLLLGGLRLLLTRHLMIW